MHDEAWDRCAFPGDFRRYQSLALDAVDRLREQGQSRAYVVLPPGAGKTVLGLEIARRIGRRTLVLTPNTAVQGQWLHAWQGFGGDDRHPLPASSGRDLEAAVTVLTYQALSVWDRSADDEDVRDDPRPGDSSADLAERRRSAVRGEDGADLLELLHPVGRDLIRRAGALGPWTLVLDECHHLLETWGALARALARALGDDTWVLGLTATPPVELTARQRSLHDDLFGDCDFSVPTPAVVKDGELAPYQELLYLTAPTTEEDTWIVGERARFAELQLELVSLRTGTLPFLDWLWRRLHLRRQEGSAAQVSWRELEEAEPALARAGLRLAQAGVVALPPGARLREEHRAAASAQDWAVLLAAYANEHLAVSSDPEDARLLDAVKQVLPGLGWTLTSRGLRTATSPVDRVCALSASKAAAAVHILGEESAALGDDLRAAVLCDFEQRGAQSPTRLADARVPPQPGSARLAFLALAQSDLGPVLRPVLCTGRTVALRREDLAGFKAFAPHGTSGRLLAEPFEGMRSLVSLTAGPGWTARSWVPLVTDWLVAGGAQVVVGTRSLLGEGWDCPPLNVVVDLSSAATATSVTQLRGRSLRLDPERPGKVADNWTVACVTDDHPRGDADYLRAVRKHQHHLAPSRAGTVESGIGHCDEALSPFAAPRLDDRAPVNGRALVRAAQRDAAREGWAVGAGYAGTEVTSLRLRTGRSLGLPGRVVPPALLAARTTLGSPAPAPLPKPRRRARLWPVPVGAAVVTSAAGTVSEGALAGAGAGLGAGVAVGGLVAAGRYAAQLRALRKAPADDPGATLRQLAHVVADALHAAGGTSAGASAVRLTSGPGGWVACELDAPAEQSALFATSLDELLAPLAEPRWLVSRLVLPAPAGRADRRRLAVARAIGRPVEAAVAWHAVPSWLGRTKARVAAFDAAWQRHVGAGRLVLAKDPEGASLLELLRGEDPFALTSRVRTVWR